MHILFFKKGVDNFEIEHKTCKFFPRGGALVSHAGYHPRKRTFKTHPKHVFSGMKIDPKYVFLNLPFLSFPKFVNMTKNTPLFQFCTFLHP